MEKKGFVKIQTALLFFLLIAFAKLFVDIMIQDYVGRAVGSALKKGMLVAVFCVLYIGIFLLMRRRAQFLEKNGNRILILFLGIAFLVQLYLGYVLSVNPQFDFSAVYDGAIEWLVTGHFTSFEDYYYYYPNNLGCMTLLLVLFLVCSKLGIQNFYMAAVVMNCILCCATIALGYYCLKKMFSAVTACFSLVLYALCIPVFLIGSAFYTDALTMIFPMLTVALFLYGGDERTGRAGRWLSDVGIALVCCLGYQLKPTVAIALIAVLFCLFLEKNFRRCLHILPVFLAGMLLFQSLFMGYFYRNHLDEETLKERKTPVETWILMGLGDNFGFSEEDTEFSRGISDPQQRKEALRGEIAKRISQRGTVGMYKHLRHKAVIGFADGTFEMSYYYLFSLQRKTPVSEKLMQYVSQLGSHYGQYWEFTSMTYYARLLLGVVFLALLLWRRKRVTRLGQKLVVPLSVFGLMLFLMLWEVHPRYTVNYQSFIILMAAAGASMLADVIAEKQK